jgi:molybdopterin synthase catalytic subunit
MDFLSLTENQIDVNGLVSQVSSPKCGAVSMFIGTTRDNFENKKVKDKKTFFSELVNFCPEHCN